MQVDCTLHPGRLHLQEILAEEPAHELKSLACSVDEEVARRGVAINREYLSLHVRVGSAARDVEVRTGDGGGWRAG